jgi:hypothetical protein
MYAMKKVVLIMMILVIFTDMVFGQKINSRDEVDFYVYTKECVKKMGKNTEDTNVYFQIFLRNKTELKIDSLFGSFLVSINDKKLFIIDFSSYEPIKKEGTVRVIEKSSYSLLRPDVYTKEEIQAVKDHENDIRTLIETDSKELTYTIVFMQVNFKNGIVHEFER